MKSSDRRVRTPFFTVMNIIIVVFSLLIQIALQVFLFLSFVLLQGPHPYIYTFIYIGLELLAIIIVLLMYSKPINIGYKLSWTIFILVLPFFGVVLYLLVGNGNSLPKKTHSKISYYLNAYTLRFTDLKEISEKDTQAGLIANALVTRSSYQLYKNTNVTYYKDALDKHKDMLKEMKNAKKFIFMEYFIFGKGEIMNDIVSILEEKGKEGVEIKILYDEIGSLTNKDKEISRRLRSIPNCEIKVYGPLGFHFNPRVNYRDHRKLTIIDGNIGYTGGDNIADEYIHLKERFGYWRDNAIRIDGAAVESLTTMFLSMWYMTSKIKIETENYLPTIKIQSNEFVLPFGDGPIYKENPAHNVYKDLITSAQKKIYISTPYFIIDDSMIDLLIEKKKQGVEVDVLIPGIPDKKSVYIMTRAHVGKLLKEGINVYTFDKGFNHAKNVIIDDKYALAGTINMDYRSFFLHFENGVFIYNSPAIQNMSKDFKETIKECSLLDYETFHKRNLFIRFFEFILQIISPLL